MTRDDIIKMAREAGWISEYDSPTGFCAEAAFKFAALVATAVAEPVQEPVAWLDPEENISDEAFTWSQSKHHTVPLYTAPPKQWVSLTDQEVWQAIDNVLEGGGWLDVARVLEQAFKEKNT